MWDLFNCWKAENKSLLECRKANNPGKRAGDVILAPAKEDGVHDEDPVLPEEASEPVVSYSKRIQTHHKTGGRPSGGKVTYVYTGAPAPPVRRLSSTDSSRDIEAPANILSTDSVIRAEASEPVANIDKRHGGFWAFTHCFIKKYQDDPDCAGMGFNGPF